MNIYIYLSHFPHNAKNINDGLSKAVHGLASGLDKSGVMVVVLCESFPNEDTSFISPTGYEIKSFANHIQTRPSFNLSPGLKQYIRTQMDGDSLVILNGIMHGRVCAMSRSLKKNKIPYIIAPHDPYNPAFFSKKFILKYSFWHLLEKRILGQALGIQILDSRHAQWLKKLKIKTPILTTPNGFSPQDVFPETSLKWGENETTKLFFLGRMDTDNKGLDLLLDAFSQITVQENIHLTFQGPDAGDKQSLQAQAKKLFIENKVSFLEPDFNKSSSAIIKEYDIFCIPSRFEGFSLAALEAMLAGRVLLVSEIAGIAPHVEKCGCGVIVTPGVSSIKSGLIELLKCRSEWQEMGLKGREYALNHLHWDKIATVALDNYKKLLT